MEGESLARRLLTAATLVLLTMTPAHASSAHLTVNALAAVSVAELALIVLLFSQVRSLGGRLRAAQKTIDETPKYVPPPLETGWHRADLLSAVETCYTDLEKAISAENLELLAEVVRGDLFDTLQTYLRMLGVRGQRKVVEEGRIDEIELVNLHTFLHSSKDRFLAAITVTSRPYLIDGQRRVCSANFSGPRTEYADASQVPLRTATEYWTFQQIGDGWMVIDIADLVSLPDRWEGAGESAS